MRAAAIAFLLLAGCSGRALSPPDTITTSIGAPVNSLQPLFATDANTQHINELIHAGLTQVAADLQPAPALALSLKPRGERAIDVELRPGCRLHDGTPITAETVQKSWRFYLDSKRPSAFGEVFSRIEKIAILGPLRLRIYTKSIEPALLTDLQLLKIMGDAEGKIGAGPYRLAKFNPQEIVLERVPGHCLGEARARRIVVKVVRDDLSRYLKLQKGELDIVLNEMNYRKVERVQNIPGTGLLAVAEPGTSYSYLGVNFSDPQLKDKRVRRAIALSLNIPELIRYKSRGYARAAASMLSPENWYANHALKPLERNLTEARALLDQAGFSNGTNGKPPLKVKLITSNNQAVIENARVLVAQALEAGIIIDHRSYEWGTFYADVKNKNTQLYLLRWVGVTDPRAYFENFHSGELKQNNRTNYQNPEMDEWITRGQATLDPKRRKAAFDHVQAIAAVDFPYVQLWHNMNAAVFRPNVRGLRLFPSGSWQSFVYLYKE